jgi:N-acetylmuramoyl-L-alanine amidase CwlA
MWKLGSGAAFTDVASTNKNRAEPKTVPRTLEFFILTPFKQSLVRNKNILIKTENLNHPKHFTPFSKSDKGKMPPNFIYIP